MKSTGQRVLVRATTENPATGELTLLVEVSGQFNKVMVNVRVFGIDPDDLEPCALPGPDEELGATLQTQEEADAYFAAMRRVLGMLEPKSPSIH
jgi:hypothetical protein